MGSVFSSIIAGEIPARFVWQDDDVVAFLTVAPLTPGHTLVVPRVEVDQWTDVDGAVLARCTEVAAAIGRAARQAWDAPRVGVVIAGFEVPHMHVHVIPAWTMADLNFDNADQNPDPAALDEAARRLRAALSAQGHHTNVPTS